MGSNWFIFFVIKHDKTLVLKWSNESIWAILDGFPPSISLSCTQSICLRTHDMPHILGAATSHCSSHRKEEFCSISELLGQAKTGDPCWFTTCWSKVIACSSLVGSIDVNPISLNGNLCHQPDFEKLLAGYYGFAVPALQCQKSLLSLAVANSFLELMWGTYKV